MDYNLLNGNTLAYLGDVVWSLYVREYLIKCKVTKTKILQQETIKYVSAKAQAKLYYYLDENSILNEQEVEIYKRGRNSKSKSSPKNTDIITYQISTGVEALIGYLYLNDYHARIKEIFDIAIKINQE